MTRGPEPDPTASVLRPGLRSPARELGPRANRTIAKVLEATHSIFLTRGYAGTTIDEIARTAGVSRASFYTYFATKRDVLLTLGADAARASDDLVRRLERVAGGWTEDDIAGFVDEYFSLLGAHGNFAFAWTQAAHEDAEIRAAGEFRHLELCEAFGDVLGAARATAFGDPRAVGLDWFAMFERSWSYCQLYDAVDPADVKAELTRLMIASLRADRPPDVAAAVRLDDPVQHRSA